MRPQNAIIERVRRLSTRSRAVGMFFATSLAARGMGIVCQWLQVPIAVHTLGSEAFGLWMTLMGFSYFITFADLGLGQGAQNKLAEAFAAGRIGDAREICESTLTVLAAVGGVLAACALVVAPRPDYAAIFHLTDPLVRSEAAATVTVMLCGFCLNFPLGLAQRLAYSLQQGWKHNVAQAAGSAGSLAGVVLAEHFRWGMTGMVAAALAPLLLSNACLLALLLWRLGWLRPLRPRCTWAAMRGLLGLGACFGVQQGLSTLMIALPPIVISTGLGAAAVTPYNLVQRLFNCFAIIQNAFMIPLWPAYSDAMVRGDFRWIRRMMSFSLKATLFATIAPMAIGAILAPWVIALWVGAAAPPPSHALIGALFLWNAASFLQQPFGYLLAGLSEVKRLTIYAGVSAAASAILMVCAVHPYGQSGVILGLLAGYLPFLILGNIFEAIRVMRRHRPLDQSCQTLPGGAALENNL